MKDYSDFFIAVYTNECKSYCDIEFFNNLIPSIENANLQIIDNSIDFSYAIKLKEKIIHKQIPIHHIDIPRNDLSTLFLRNVTESVNVLRYFFLQTKCKYFITIESDVVPPQEWLLFFKEVIGKADIIGGIYYEGFHRKELFENPNIFENVPHALSGCTLYKRKVIEKIPFRYSLTNIGAFPDAWMCYDAKRQGFQIANYSKIKCIHLTKENSMSRGLEDLK